MAPWIDQLVREHRPLPFVAQFVAATGDLSWAPAIALGITLPALLLPDGRLRSRRWRVVVVTSVTGAALTILASPLVPGPLEEMGIENPFGLAGPAGKVAATLAHAGILLHWLSLPPAAVCVVLRFRSSRGVERQQLRRAAAGAAGAVAAFSPLRHRVQGLVDRRFNAAATTPPAPSRGSPPTCATRSTWMRCRVSCWPWSTRPCSPPGPRCGSAAPPDGGVPVVGGVGYALGRRCPAPDLRSGAHAAGSWRERGPRVLGTLVECPRCGGDGSVSPAAARGLRSAR